MPAQKYVDKHSLKILNMEPTGIPPNNSHQHLMNGEDYDSMDTIVPPLTSNQQDPSIGGKTNSCVRAITPLNWLTVIVLFYVNLINYMDRYTVAGKNTFFLLSFNITSKYVNCWYTFGAVVFCDCVD